MNTANLEYLLVTGQYECNLEAFGLVGNSLNALDRNISLKESSKKQ